MSDIPILDSGDPDFLEKFEAALEEASPSDFLTAALDPKRAYSGQPQTTDGVRGKQLVGGLTMRDLKDCFIVGAFHSSGLLPEEYPKSVYDLDWAHFDPIAVWQNMACEIERRMGIYPNLAPIEGAEATS